MNIIGHKNIFLIFSGFLAAASLAALAFWGIKLGIDFTGGALMELEYKERPVLEEINPALSQRGITPCGKDTTTSLQPCARSAEYSGKGGIKTILQPLNLGDVEIQPSGDKGIFLRMRDIDENTHQQILQNLRTKAGAGNEIRERQFTTIGPTIGQELKRKAYLALGLASFCIILYLAWAFRNVSRPVSSWKYGLIAVLVAFLHDVLIPVGFFSALGHFRSVEVDTLFITALLTILGFSVHDTIVVFDRIRENLRKLQVAEDYALTVNRSVNETWVRSLNTSFTVLLVLCAIFILGGETTRFFSLALILGIIFGTYSSIFVASPLLVIWNQLTKKSERANL